MLLNSVDLLAEDTVVVLESLLKTSSFNLCFFVGIFFVAELSEGSDCVGRLFFRRLKGGEWAGKEGPEMVRSPNRYFFLIGKESLAWFVSTY